MRTDTTSADFFDNKYRLQEDPWDFASSSYEHARYDAIVQSLSHRRYRFAFEPGCSIGMLTARLALICGHVHAVDISAIAVQHARKRCKAITNVEIHCGALPAAIPPGPLDLVVLSEIGYYLEQDALTALGKTLIGAMSERGVLLAAHWLGYSEDHVSSGDGVHEILTNLPRIALEHSERHAGFRLDRWVKA